MFAVYDHLMNENIIGFKPDDRRGKFKQNPIERVSVEEEYNASFVLDKDFLLRLCITQCLRS